MYTVKEAAHLLGISPHTVRYYTNQDLTPHLSRSQNGARLFDDRDIAYLQVTIYLRNCGMPIQKIREYFSLAEKGDSTIQERYEMLLDQQEDLKEQLRKLTQSQDYISHKLQIYSEYIRKNENSDNEAQVTVSASPPPVA